MLGPSAHTDTFTRDRLPPLELWPELILDGFEYPEFINAATELTDRMVERGFGDNIALIGAGRKRTYKELTDWSNRLAAALVGRYGVEPGNRILIRSANNPAMVACWLAATKAGAVVVNTMPMLRATELSKIINKAEISLALCDSRLTEELEKCIESTDYLQQVVTFDGSPGHDAELDLEALDYPAEFEPVGTGRDDVALLGFTSGTTGEPKATMHFHRDILVIADGYAKEILNVTSEDVFAGSPPLAFTFGLGGLAVFPLRFGAAACLFENAAPQNLMEIIRDCGVTICFTAPTAYRVMLDNLSEKSDFSSLRIAVSAGETLPATIYEEWADKVSKPMLDGIGATELLHIFITNRLDDHQPACTGRPVSGYEAKIINDEGSEVTDGEVGMLAVRGPTGCRYLADDRQHDYVNKGWNITGDAFWRDNEGFYHFAARNDDMIVSSGYNIAGPEVEAALLKHSDVAECAVVGADDVTRGQIVEAHIVLRPGVSRDDQTVDRLQNYVKSVIAPYKYPRRIVFRDELPKTLTGKIQRFVLRKN